MISVLIPSYRRPAALGRCIVALARQTRPAEEIIVVARDDDAETQAVLSKLIEEVPRLRVLSISRPGQVGALNAALQAATGDIVAITDDDAVPAADWLERIAAYFGADGRLAGVGGRDRVHHEGRIETGERTTVGVIRWFGRPIGNHHLGSGPPRRVDVLKGANCAYRRSSIASFGFDERCHGTGAQVHWEMSLGLRLRRKGLALVYDPRILVDHYIAPRAGEQRGTPSRTAIADAAFNETYALVRWLPLWRKPLAFGYALLIGSRSEPGVLRVLDRRGQADLRGQLRGVGAAVPARFEALRACLAIARGRP
jgi:glycosyltransferase involved in cell wall biosynthesis